MYFDSQHGRTIDVYGPEGNAYNLLGVAKQWSKQLGWDWPTLEHELTAGDYDHLIRTFRDKFKHVVRVIGYDFDKRAFIDPDDDYDYA